nr:hypothetical protein [Tanacetum cinerariifolium]
RLAYRLLMKRFLRNNDDDQEIFHDAIESASEKFIENHIDSQKDYDKSDVDHNDSEEKDHLVDKLIRKFNKKIVKCQKSKDLRPTLYDEKVIGLGYTLMFLTHSDEALEIEKFKRLRENKIKFAYDYGNLNVSYVNDKINFEDDYFQEIINPDFEKIDSPFHKNDCLVVEKECDQEENPKVIAPGMFKLNVSLCVSPISMSKTSCESINVEIKLKRKRHTFSSVRIPKNSCVIWKKKGSSNISNVGETSSASVCNDAMNVSCNSRMCDLLDDNNFFIFDDESVKISPVSKMPFRKKHRDSMNVRSKRCSKHMTGNRALFTNFVEKFLETVRFGNNDFTVIAGYEDVVIGSMTIKKVYYVEGLGHNLFSVRQFCDKGLEVTFRKSTCFVRNEDGVDLLTGDRSSNLYTIALNEVASNSSICLIAKASSSQSWLWHQHFSHLNFALINNLVKNNLVQGLPKMKFEKDHLCSAYEQGKIHRKHHKSKTDFASNKPLYHLYMDLFSRVRTDNGTEFKNKTLAKFFDEVGITQQFFVARTPQQNVVVERRNRTLVEAARTMLTFANLPSFLWAEDIATTCFTQNHLIIHKHFDKTPYELIKKRKPNIKFFRVFGCRCYLLNDYEDVGKLKAKGDIRVFVGYSKDLEPGLSKLNETRKSSNPSVSKGSKASKKDLEDLFQDFYDEYFDSSKIMKSSTTNVETPIIEEVFHEVSKSFQGESSSSSLNDDVQQCPEEVILPQINTQLISINMIPNGDEASTSHNMFNEHLEDAYFDASTLFHDSSNVHTFYQPYPHKKKWTKDHPLYKMIALRDIDWVSAMQEELDQFTRLNV